MPMAAALVNPLFAEKNKDSALLNKNWPACCKSAKMEIGGDILVKSW
jgi:hypothetical protein